MTQFSNVLVMRNIGLAQDLIMKSDIGDIVENTLRGQRIGTKECIRLIKSTDAVGLGAVGNLLRQRLFGNTASFINNIILNYTNVCVTYCKFCAFYRPPGHKDIYPRIITVRDRYDCQDRKK